MKRKLLSILALLCMTVASAWADSFSTEPYSSDVTLSGVTVSSDMTITINSGVTVTVNNGLSISSGKTLTVVGDGTLRVNGAGGSTAVSGNIIVQGATVRATGGNGSAGGNGGAGSSITGSDTAGNGSSGYNGGNGGAAFSGAVVIYSGQISGQGGAGGSGGNGGAGGTVRHVLKNGGNGGNGGSGGAGGNAFGGTLTVYGGNVNAIGGSCGSGGSGGAGGANTSSSPSGKTGSHGSGGSIGSNANAFSNSSNNPTLINTTDGKMYSDSGHTTEINSVSGQRNVYITSPNAILSLTLSEATDNSVALADNDGRLVLNITLTRTLQTGGWNTFSVPFSIAKPSGWTVKELTDASFEDATNTLSLTFGDAESIVAGHAYLVQVESAVENPTFNDVAIVNGTTPTTISGVVEFVPAINPTALTLDDKSCLFVSGGNSLTWASSGSAMNGFRAYFHILDGSIANARAFSMDFGGDDVTGIISVTADERGTDGAVYTLDGRKLNGQPTQKGVYVVNGKKVIIK